MKKIFHIVASPRGDDSRTLELSEAFLSEFLKKHPDWMVDELNLWTEKLPPMTMKRVDGKYMLLGGKDLFGEFKEAWEEIIQHIDRFKAADLYLVSTPMWNFSIPYMLKQYIDIIVQPKFLFHYTPTGPEGLITNKKMIICTSRGGDYSSDAMKPFDHQEPYLRTVFGFVGIKDITFLNAQPMDLGKELQQQKLQEAKALAHDVADRLST
jgi:FMN-dependent NADH-azoreductase